MTLNFGGGGGGGGGEMVAVLHFGMPFTEIMQSFNLWIFLFIFYCGY